METIFKSPSNRLHLEMLLVLHTLSNRDEAIQFAQVTRLSTINMDFNISEQPYHQKIFCNVRFCKPWIC